MPIFDGMRRRWIRAIVLFMSAALVFLFIVIMLVLAKILSDDYSAKCMNYSRQTADNIVMKTEFIESMTSSIAERRLLNEVYRSAEYNIDVIDTLREMKNFSAYIYDIYFKDANSNVYATSTVFANSLKDFAFKKEQWLVFETAPYAKKILYVKPLYHDEFFSGYMVFDISFDGFVKSIIDNLTNEYNICFYDSYGTTYVTNNAEEIPFINETVLRRGGSLYIRENIDELDMQMIVKADISSVYANLSPLVISLIVFYLIYITIFSVITAKMTSLITEPLKRLYDRMDNFRGGVDIMYKILIVDDEYYARYGLRESIDWAQYDCEIIGEATDAEEAYEKCSQYMPDIVITDIRMEDTNGLDFIKKVYSAGGKKVRFIILSGYSEFSYAARAIEYGVSAYLTKPVTNSDLIETIEKVKKEIDAERISTSAMNTLEEELPKIKNIFLSNWLSGRLEEREITEKSQKYGLPINYPYFCIGAVSHISENTSTLLRQYIGKLLITHGGIEILTVDIINEHAFIIFSEKADRSALYGIFKDITERLSEIADTPIDSGISNMYDSISYVPAAFEEAKKMLNEGGEQVSAVGNYRYETLRALAIIKDEFNLQISASYVAEKINVSTSHFMFLFKTDTGKTFSEYLTEYRIKKAVEFIKSHKYKIYEISEKVGYKNPKYFRKQFKKYTGKKPTDYYKD